jgi:hypothetical protein
METTHPSRLETYYDPVVGLVRFRPAALAAWLDDELYPQHDMSDLDMVFYDLGDHPHRAVRAILDEARGQGLGVRIERDRVLLWGCPGDAPYAWDDVGVAGACLKAADHRGEGVVLFLGTTGMQNSDFALALGRGKYDVRFVDPYRKPPRLPVAAAELADTVGRAFRARKDVAQALARVGYDVRPVRAKERDGRLRTKRAATQGARAR